MKPVLHISETERAATICGSIAPDSFVDDSVDVTVIWHGPEGDETYTQVIVDKQDDFDGTGFCIFWLVPDQDYTVQIDNGFDTAYEEPVFAGDLGPGASYDLNGSEDIEIPEP